MDRWGIIADDNTGAMDAAGMLTERGVRTLLILDAAAIQTTPCDGFDALVVGTQNRSVAPTAAAAATRSAITQLREVGVNRFQLKYCSTFDSTREGNIGSMLDAALSELDLSATLVNPSLPVNGRTLYQGHLFVGDQLLSESPLRDHPLNPMTDSNIVRWLQYQTEKKVGHIDLATVRQGAEALAKAIEQKRDEGCAYLVVDSVIDEDILTQAQATESWPLLTGGSGITAAIAAVHFAEASPLNFDARLKKIGAKTLVVSGSQSPMTRKQTQQALQNGFSGLQLEISNVLRNPESIHDVIAEARSALDATDRLLVYSPSDGPKGIQAAQALGRELGLNDVETGERIANALGILAQTLVQEGSVNRLVISGGETSGAVCDALGVRAMEVGLQLAPGVPYGFPIGCGPDLLVLKSGNFGSETLYEQVADLA